MNRIITCCRVGALLLLLTVAWAAIAAPEPAAENEPTPAAEPTAPAAGEDKAASPGDPRERAVAERLRLTLPGVEQLWLDTAAGPYLTVHRPASEPVPHGGLIINSAPGTVVEDSQVLRRIAENAVAGGWSVLSLQQIDSGGPVDAAIARIDAALAHFAAAGVQNIVIVSDAGGATAALASIAANRSRAIAGFIALGAWLGDPAGLEVSILDVAGTRDPRALNAQQLRKAAARDYAKPVELLQIDGADPKFHGYEDAVGARVRGWLKRATPGVALRQ